MLNVGLVTHAQFSMLGWLTIPRPFHAQCGAGYPGTQFWGWLPWHSILGLVTLTLNSGAGYPGTQLPMLISAM